MNPSKNHLCLIVPTVFIFCFGIQVLLFGRIYSHLETKPTENYDLILTYSDEGSMQPVLDLALSQRKPLYISISPPERNPLFLNSILGLKNVYVESNANTTDQNARYAAKFIRRGNYKNVVLDVGWFHVPRALFLTKLYLLGSGVKVIPCAKVSAPFAWWTRPLFWVELLKFWGSIGRVVLAFWGWETGLYVPVNRK